MKDWYSEHIKLLLKEKKDNPILIWTKIKTYSVKGIWIISYHIKKSPVLSVIWGMEIKTTVKYHYFHTRMTGITR